MGALDRRLAGALEEGLATFRVVVVNGPRQSGKSTLLEAAAARLGAPLVTLDRRADLRTARTDPEGFLAGHARPLFVDEVQRGGDPLVLAVKADVDVDRRPGRFVLSGSTRFLLVPTLSESLAGRMVLLDLWPLSQGEIRGGSDGFVDAAFVDPDGLRRADAPALSRREVAELVVAGGFPEVVLGPTGRFRSQWFDTYVTTLVERDVTDIATVRRRSELPVLARLLAARTAGEVSVQSLATDLGLSHATTRTYLSLLEAVYLHRLVPAFAGSVTTSLVHRPKVHVVDSGVAAHLLGLGVDRLADPTEDRLGPLLETFVAGELVKQLSWSETRPHLLHLRDSDGHEVDLVLEAPDGRVVGIEVKAAVSVDDHDTRHLRWLRDRLGDRFHHGVVVHLGDRPRPLGDRLTALPVSALWAVG